MSEINNTLNERGARYGNYSDVAGTTQQLMSIVESGANYAHLNAEQKTSLFMICNKIARAVNGDPQYFDNYRNIAGYATLAERACEVVDRHKAIMEPEKKPCHHHWVDGLDGGNYQAIRLRVRCQVIYQTGCVTLQMVVRPITRTRQASRHYRYFQVNKSVT